MGRLFGTDGIRGKANTQLKCQTAFLLGQAIVRFMGKRVLVARDTRISGQMLENSLAAGVMSAGGDCYLAGIIPTPATAFLVRKDGFDAGVVISASHNPPEYNGLKVFDGAGLKLPDEVEDKIESFILNANEQEESMFVDGDKVGVSKNLEKAQDEYVDFICESILSQNLDFKGMTIALDAGHGASYFTSKEALSRLGANVLDINANFNGRDINVECGSTHLSPLKDLVKTTAADIGIAHDGDADRVMMLSPGGVEIDGDIVLNVLAEDLKEQDKLKNNTVVGTVMSNLGLKIKMKEAGINFVEAKVGDRYVLEQMQKGDFVLGGEQSGHVIMLDHNTTGDGLMTAVQFLAAVKRSGKSVDELVSSFKKFPQVLINVSVDDKEESMKNPAVLKEVEDAERELGDGGRVLLRPSGTEPVVRVMVEAFSQEIAESHARRIANKL